MRVLSVVTLVSPDGAFGGPVRVAENQARALRERGHQVVVAAASRGFVPPETLGGAPLLSRSSLQLVPGAGFSGLTSPGLLSRLWREIPKADVVHVHLGRDLVTLPAALMAMARHKPFVVQPHGMVVASDNPVAPALDALATRRVLGNAAAVFYLTEAERQGLETVRPGSRLVPLGNGVPVAAVPAGTDDVPEVLYLARLQARKRPLFFVEAARDLLASGVQARFTLVGPDEGEGAAVRAAIEAVGDPRLSWEGPLDPSQTLERMARSSVYVLPSVHEPYPMSVLEALSLGRPVVITDTCGVAPMVAAAGAGRVVDAEQASLTGAIAELVADAGARESAGKAAVQLAEQTFSMEAVAATLESTYEDAIAGRS